MSLFSKQAFQQYHQYTDWSVSKFTLVQRSLTHQIISGGIHVSCSIGRYTVDLGDVKAGKVTINQSFQKRTGSENFRNEIIFNPNITCIIPRVIVFTQGKLKSGRTPNATFTTSKVFMKMIVWYGTYAVYCHVNSLVRNICNAIELYHITSLHKDNCKNTIII